MLAINGIGPSEPADLVFDVKEELCGIRCGYGSGIHFLFHSVCRNNFYVEGIGLLIKPYGICDLLGQLLVRIYLEGIARRCGDRNLIFVLRYAVLESFCTLVDSTGARNAVDDRLCGVILGASVGIILHIDLGSRIRKRDRCGDIIKGVALDNELRCEIAGVGRAVDSNEVIRCDARDLEYVVGDIKEDIVALDLRNDDIVV